MTKIANTILTPSKRVAIIAVRSEGKSASDVVNLREYNKDGDNFVKTVSGFSIPSADFAEFFKALRKFGRNAGLLGKAGDDEFEIVALDDVDATKGEDIKIKGTPGLMKSTEGATSEKKTGIKRSLKKVEGDAKAKKPKAEAADDDGDDAFDMKAFKKAIRMAIKHDDDTSYMVAVMAIYKSNRKALKAGLPKHAVNAFEKSLENKKDESFMAKAMLAAQKHIVEKDFSL